MCGDIEIKGWNGGLLVKRRHYFESTNCQEAGAGADKIRNNSLLLTEEFNYRLYVECLCLQQCLSSHLI